MTEILNAILPYVATVIGCYVTVKVCLARHSVQIEQIEKSLERLTDEVRANNEVKNRVSVLEEKVKWIEKEGRK